MTLLERLLAWLLSLFHRRKKTPSVTLLEIRIE